MLVNIKFEPNFKTPTPYELRAWISKEKVAFVDDFIQQALKSLAKYGCTIMFDGLKKSKLD